MSIATVKKSLDDMTDKLVKIEKSIRKGRDLISVGVSDLNELPARYDDAITEINGYVPTGPHETLAKDELGKLTAEFVAVRNGSQTAIADLDAVLPSGIEGL
jgi:hypothetical protein